MNLANHCTFNYLRFYLSVVADTTTDHVEDYPYEPPPDFCPPPPPVQTHVWDAASRVSLAHILFASGFSAQNSTRKFSSGFNELVYYKKTVHKFQWTHPMYKPSSREWMITLLIPAHPLQYFIIK